MNSTFEEQLAQHGRLVYPNVGDSMMPLLRQKQDLMVIDAKGDKRCRKYDAVLYHHPNGEYVMHRILKVKKGEYILCGDNRWVREHGVKEEWVIGILTAVIRDGKELSASSWKYRLYAHLCVDFYYLKALTMRLRSLGRRAIRKLFR
jgi:hypothetical protein